MRRPKGPNTMPDTSWYYHVAYTVALSIYAGYALSLYVRLKRVKREP
jgi:hypothetical protein